MKVKGHMQKKFWAKTDQKKKGGFTLKDIGSTSILAFLRYATLKRPQKIVIQYSFCMVSF